MDMIMILYICDCIMQLQRLENELQRLDNELQLSSSLVRKRHDGYGASFLEGFWGSNILRSYLDLKMSVV